MEKGTWGTGRVMLSMKAAPHPDPSEDRPLFSSAQTKGGFIHLSLRLHGVIELSSPMALLTIAVTPTRLLLSFSFLFQGTCAI